MHEISRWLINSLGAEFVPTDVLSIAIGKAAAHESKARGVVPRVQKMQVRSRSRDPLHSQRIQDVSAFYKAAIHACPLV